MLRRSPANVTFEVGFPENRNMEDVFLNIFEEWLICFVTAHPKRLSDVLKEMNMAYLDDDVGKDVLCSLFDCRVIIAGHGYERVVCILEPREELHPPPEALRCCEEACR